MYILTSDRFGQFGQLIQNQVTETIWNWERYSDQIPPGEQRKIDKMADLIVSSFVPGSQEAPFRSVKIVGHADTDNVGTKMERTAKELAVSKRRAFAVKDALTAAVKALWAARKMGPPPVGGVAWNAVWKGATELIAGPYNRANRRVEVTLIRSGLPIPPPPPCQDTLPKRIERCKRLLDQLGMPGGAEQTRRMKCVMSKRISILSDEDMYVSGSSGTFVTGKDGKGFFAHLCPPAGIPEAVFGSKLTIPQKAQFFRKVSRDLSSKGFSCQARDAQVLELLGLMDRDILKAISCLHSHIERNGQAADRWRVHLNDFIAKRQKDENSIYSCYR